VAGSLAGAAPSQSLPERRDAQWNDGGLGRGDPLPVGSLVQVCELAMSDQQTQQPSPPTPRSMQLFVKLLTGRTTVLEVMTNTTIEQVKEILLDRGHVPPDQVRLGFNGKQLEDGRQLDEYNLQDGSTIEVLLRLRGGQEKCVQGVIRPHKCPGL
jgi:large subunit ribosomal protein L40e